MEKLRVYYYDLMVWSVFAYILSVLFLSFLFALQTGIFQMILGINFELKPFGIVYHSYTVGKWTEPKILVVFGLGTAIYFLFGRLVLMFMRFLTPGKMFYRLLMVWVAFLAVHMLPAGMVSGVFFFDNFGIAYKWLFSEFWIRVFLALAAIIFSMFMRPFWLGVFQEITYSRELIGDAALRVEYIRWVFVIPYTAGTLILAPFTLQGDYYAWYVVLVSLGLVVYPVISQLVPDALMLPAKADPPKEINIRVFAKMFAVILVLFILGFFGVMYRADG